MKRFPSVVVLVAALTMVTELNAVAAENRADPAAASLNGTVYAGLSPKPLALAWMSQQGREHPLTGQIYSIADKSTVDEAFLLSALMSADIALAGEIHDNQDHRRVQARLLQLMAAQRPEPPAVVVEQFDATRQAALDQFQRDVREHPDLRTIENLKRVTDWGRSGWNKYDYDAMFEATLDRGLQLYAGDVARPAMMKVAMEGAGAVASADQGRLSLDVPLGTRLDAASIDEIYEAHCQKMPKETLGGMAFAQRYRDATLADNVLKAAGKHGTAILIAGDGHVRTDRGVPWYIRHRAPDKHVVSVTLVEVEDGKVDPETYSPRDPDGKPATDFIIFTPKAERTDDPCVRFKAKPMPAP